MVASRSLSLSFTPNRKSGRADIELVIHFVLVVVRDWQGAPARVVLGQSLLDELSQLLVEKVLDDLPLVVLHAGDLCDRLRELKQRRVQPFGFGLDIDRKSTRLNSSHLVISYAVFCL